MPLSLTPFSAVATRVELTNTTCGHRFGAPAVAAGFGFSAPSATPEASPGGVIDPEIAQCLKRLTKRDTGTKLKALRALPALITAGTPDATAELLPSWIFSFKRVVLDNNRSVRLAAVKVLEAILTACGRKVAPQLKTLLGPWWFAMSDPYREAAASATAAFEVRLLT